MRRTPLVPTGGVRSVVRRLLPEHGRLQVFKLKHDRSRLRTTSPWDCRRAGIESGCPQSSSMRTCNDDRAGGVDK
ncbi:MAG: hypothetical protein GY842_22050 [bacterium]|nr:hypothetical protein [bacterium]